ncbi:unnamed protein product [Protopolystoma xenopodis]|uniref:Uncharacterized protein n=1 Tax=Protopolystoma xenopodis TaxID=117903 RepID=A0A448WDW6_9PLAT|nr:unnamed protein product [Protopolystoma xenopodis]
MKGATEGKETQQIDNARFPRSLCVGNFSQWNVTPKLFTQKPSGDLFNWVPSVRTYRPEMAVQVGVSCLVQSELGRLRLQLELGSCLFRVDRPEFESQFDANLG